MKFTWRIYWDRNCYKQVGKRRYEGQDCPESPCFLSTIAHGRAKEGKAEIEKNGKSIH